MSTESQDFDPDPEFVRLPLWKACLDKMREEGVDYGKVYTAGFFEWELRTTRETRRFGTDVYEIRRELEKDGFELSGEGMHGNQFVILPAASNASVMERFSRKAAEALKRAVILGNSTRMDGLSESERRRHESVLERTAIKAVLIQRSQSVAKYLTDSKPDLLKKDTAKAREDLHKSGAADALRTVAAATAISNEAAQ